MARRSHGAGALALPSTAQAQDKEVVFGVHCDRTGATQIVGTVHLPRLSRLLSPWSTAKGGVEGYKIKAIEIDNEYKVPPAIEAHERFKKEGAIATGAVWDAARAGADQRSSKRTRSSARRRASARRPAPTASATPISSRSRPATGARARPRSTSPRSSLAATSRARRSPTSTTTIRPARSRSSFSRIWRSPKASS